MQGFEEKLLFWKLCIQQVFGTNSMFLYFSEDVLLITGYLKAEVSISVEIQADSDEGFDENLRRTVKENCNVLKFKNAEFED